MPPMRLKQRTSESTREPRPSLPPRKRVVQTTASAPLEPTSEATRRALTVTAEHVALDAAPARAATFYERSGKRLVDLAALAVALPLACAVALPIAAWNLIAF